MFQQEGREEGAVQIMARDIRLFSIASVCLLLMASSASAQGESGAGSLIIPPGARANAMGQSYVAIADDATAMWWNPAGLGFIDRAAVDLMHSQLVPDLASDVFFEYFGGVYRIQGIGVIGASVQYLTYGEWTHTKLTPEDLGTASSWEIAPMIGGAVRLGERLSVGMNLKFVYVSLAPAWATIEGTSGTGHSVAVDFGGLWKVPDFDLLGLPVRRLNLGLAVTNLGPSITFINRDQAADLPRNLRGGFAYTPILGDAARFTIAAEVNRPLVEFKRSNTFHAGAEFVYAELIAVRAGYVYDKDGNIKDPTYGLGFMFNNRVRIDWASVPQSQELARVHRWSLGFTF
jgi:hypothetical protein